MDGRPESIDLEIRLFGGWQARVGGEPMRRLRSRSEQNLLAWLVLHSGSDVARERLAGILWPESAPDRGLFYLRRGLTDLRHALGPEAARLRSPSPRTLRFDASGPSVFIDVLAFDAAAAQSTEESLAYAVELYRGPLFPECGETWALEEREAREWAYVDALEQLARRAVERHAPETAVRWLQQVVRTDPARETARQALLQALAASGDMAGMVQAYQTFRLYLHDELHAAPSAETVALFDRLRKAGLEGPARAPRDTARPASSEPRSLPCPLTPLIDREIDLEDAYQRLRSCRLMTLCGAGGVGKTRLAIALGEKCIPEFADHVCFVDLSSTLESSAVAGVVASTLMLTETATQSPMDALITCLMHRELLLILDNCEQIIDAAALLTETLITRCAGLKILATSREPLRIPGEITWRVPSLSLPRERSACPIDPGADARKDRAGEILQSGAVRLFVDRALRADTGWMPRNLEIIAAICRMLDGIPLAIELAAARTNVVSETELLARLDDRLLLLDGGSRSRPRQQTLRATMDWSYDLLNNQEKLLLQRLSVFAGGWTLEAAEQVCAGSVQDSEFRSRPAENTPQGLSFDGNSETLEDCEVLDRLTSLVRKSLVLYEAGEGQARYRMMETIRQYARDRLAGSHEHYALKGRHRDHYLMLAEAAKPKLSGSEQAHWVAVLEEEHDNLRQALRWCLEEPEGSEKGLRLGIAMHPFWHIRSHLSEGRAHLRELLTHIGAQTPTNARAGTLSGAGLLAYSQGDYIAARDFHEESLEIRRKLVDKRGIAGSLNNLGIVFCSQGDYRSARSLHEESLSIMRELGDRQGIAHSLNNLGDVVSNQGEYTLARSLYRESLAIRRELGDKYNIAYSLNNLGAVACSLGEFPSARPLHEESLAIFREMGDRRGIAWSLNNLGNLAHCQSNYDSARALHAESLEIQRDLGDKHGIANSLSDLGKAFCSQGDYRFARSLYAESLALFRELGDRSGIAISLERYSSLAVNAEEFECAARVGGAVAALREAIASPLMPNEREKYEQDLARARFAMGEAAFAAAWEEGRAMALDGVVKQVLSDTICDTINRSAR
jgi:predicted ATPase/DNA-binding SARP family transcriptional activator/Tfp pilus assembly protein PilF